jgi:hypothetical protein
LHHSDPRRHSTTNGDVRTLDPLCIMIITQGKTIGKGFDQFVRKLNNDPVVIVQAIKEAFDDEDSCAGCF